MQYTVAAFLALAGTALAQTEGFDPILAPGKDSVLAAGDTFTIEWEASPSDFDAETIDILLLAGDSPGTLDVAGEPVAEGLENSAGSFDWEIPSDLGDDKTYGLKIQLSSDPTTFQFSFPFQITPSEGGDEEPIGNSTTTAEPSTTATSDDSEATGDDYDSSTVSKPKTTLTTTVDGDSTATGGVTPSTNSPGAGAQATAGAFALIGGLAVAALAL